MSDDPRIVVATHDGRQHADEVLACWFMQVLHGGEAKIVRTSDHALQAKADVLLDCGGVYNPSKGRIDHHGGAVLPSPPGERLSGYATAGLVWRLYGARICEILLSESMEGPWLSYKSRISKEQEEHCYQVYAHILDQEIVAPIDAWDLGIYPDKHLSRQILPFQWMLPHLEFEAAMNALGKAFLHRLRTLAETVAGESNLEQDMLENGPCEFWIFGPWLMIKAQDGKRVELKAAKRFASRVLNMPLLAVLSSIRGGSRWGAFLTAPLPHRLSIPPDLEYAAGRRSFFHNSPWRLLQFLKECAEGNELQVPFNRVESDP